MSGTELGIRVQVKDERGKACALARLFAGRALMRELQTAIDAAGKSDGGAEQPTYDELLDLLAVAVDGGLVHKRPDDGWVWSEDAQVVVGVLVEEARHHTGRVHQLPPDALAELQLLHTVLLQAVKERSRVRILLWSEVLEQAPATAARAAAR